MHKNYYSIVAAALIGGATFAAVAFAQDDEGLSQGTVNTKATEEKREVLKKQLENQRETLKKQVEVQRETLKDQLENEREAMKMKIEGEREKFKSDAEVKLRALRTASSTEREKIHEELKDQREALEESVKEMREKTREDAKTLREEFREKVKSETERARIGVAHGRGLKMLNRYRAAILRFDHIIGLLEDRLAFLKSRGIDVASVTPMIEEAKNMKTDADADLQNLQVKYEDLLKGGSATSTAADAKVLAQTLKTKLEVFHDKLKTIAKAIRALAPKESDEDEDEEEGTVATTTPPTTGTGTTATTTATTTGNVTP